jgi:hypothetical protein
VVFLGDRYTAAKDATGVRWGYAVQLARIEGWRPYLLGIGGSGFVNPGPCHVNNVYATRYAAVVRAHPDAVILEGGLNDLAASPAYEKQLVVAGIHRLSIALPGVPLALVGPTVPNAAIVAKVAPITRAFRLAASATAVRFDAGYRYMARRAAVALRGWLS